MVVAAKGTQNHRRETVGHRMETKPSKRRVVKAIWRLIVTAFRKDEVT